MKKFKSDCLLFTIGGLGYALLEILWRGKTHWSMALTGGTCFVSIFRLYKHFPKMKLRIKCLCGGAIITALEYICGLIVNIKFKLNVWDYSNCRLNLMGQICPFYSMLWSLLCIPLSVICKLLCKSKRIV